MKNNTRKSRQATKQPLGIYANYVGASWGVSEINVTLSQIRADGPEWPRSEVGRVSLSPVAAKALIVELMAAVLAFETVHGPVSVHPKAVQPMPTSQLFTADALARLAILRAELFPASVAQAEGPPEVELDDKVTKH